MAWQVTSSRSRNQELRTRLSESKISITMVVNTSQPFFGATRVGNVYFYFVEVGNHIEQVSFQCHKQYVGVRRTLNKIGGNIQLL